MSNKLEPIARQLSIRAVIDAFLQHGAITRTQLAEQTGLSKQTMSEVVRELEANGWLRVGGTAAGSVGRRAVIYEFEETACYVVGVDLGGSNMRAAIATLNGNIVAETSEVTDSRGGRFVVEQVGSVVDRLILASGVERSRIDSGAIAVSGVVQRSTGAVMVAQNIRGISDMNFIGAMEERLRMPVLVENAVDMATKGELWRGGGKGIDNFVFIGHGAGIGLGAVLEGRLLKGRKGAIGEICFLPIGGDPYDPRELAAGRFEAAVGAAGMVRRYEAYGGATGATVRDIFAALGQQSAAAEAVIDETARLVALAVASALAVLDPDLVVMGGNIGIQPEMVRRVNGYLARCTPLQTRLEASALGARAQLIGAVKAAMECAYDKLFGVRSSVP